MSKLTVLNLELVVDERHVSRCAEELQRRLPPDQWKLLASLAAEIVARWETTAAGSTVLVLTGRGRRELEAALAAAPVAGKSGTAG